MHKQYILHIVMCVYFSMISVRHCVLICNSPPYQIGAEESIDYNGFNSEQLASMMGKVSDRTDAIVCFSVPGRVH